MADLDRRLESAKLKFNRAIDRFSNRFGPAEIDLFTSIIFLPQNPLLRSAMVYAISHHGHLLSYLGAPLRSTLKKTSVIHIQEGQIDIWPHLEHKQLFHIFLLGAVSFAIELLLDELESKTPKTTHLDTATFPSDPVEGLERLETFAVIQIMEGIYSEKELGALRREMLAQLVNKLEKDHPDFFDRVKDLGNEAKLKAFIALEGPK